ncbi:MAG: hypothetical protein ACE5GE_13515, partial [Phycisphaerae bacterium]
ATVPGSAYFYRGLSDCNRTNQLDICDIEAGSSADCNTNGLPDECDALGMLNLPLDIKPGVCPNRLNLAGQGRLAVALLGSASFDASQVDPFSITLSRADCLGGQVSPVEGPPGPWSVLRDVATPFDGVGSPVCTSHDAAADGFADLFMHFDSQNLVNVLNLYSLPPGEVVELTVRGSLWDGTPFVGADRVRLLIPAMPIKIGLRNPATR